MLSNSIAQTRTTGDVGGVLRAANLVVLCDSRRQVDGAADVVGVVGATNDVCPTHATRLMAKGAGSSRMFGAVDGSIPYGLGLV